MELQFKNGARVALKWHPQFKSGWKDALAGRKPTRKYKFEKQQREYNRGYSLGVRAVNHAYAQKLADLFCEGKS